MDDKDTKIARKHEIDEPSKDEQPYVRQQSQQVTPASAVYDKHANEEQDDVDAQITATPDGKRGKIVLVYSQQATLI